MTLPPLRPRVFVGEVAPLCAGGPPSAIGKRPAPAPWRIGALGLEGDAQADRKHHGGTEKALHHYPFEHYDFWRREIGERPALLSPGGFGENLSTIGWTEEEVCVGDVIRFGEALVQVSQGRQPCFKLNLRFEVKDMARRVQNSGRTGWYYRVLEPGVAREEDALELVERPSPDWPLARLTGAADARGELACACAAAAGKRQGRELERKALRPPAGEPMIASLPRTP